jgi:predicted MFS family arabinose efflux permease
VKGDVKFFLVAMIAVSVISDSMLIPFYPQFFDAAFSVSDPRHVGFYLAAVCLVVMLAFPVWATAGKRAPVLRLLIYTQFAAGVLSLLCYWADSLVEFWLVSLSMMAFKASYLLIYPFVLSLEDKRKHTGTIGLLSVIVHLGAILGASVGGFVLQFFEPRQTFLLMSIGDFLQMAVCFFLTGQTAMLAGNGERQQKQEPATETSGKELVYKLCLIMLLYYFGAYLIRPFFSRYWESVSLWNGEIISGLVFAIPGIMALLALCLGKFLRGNYDTAYDGIVPAIFLGVVGLLLQAYPHEALVLLGRCLFGWSLFKATVRLDALLFELSNPEAYAADFSKIYFFQSLGVLVASFAAGSSVALHGLRFPFLAGAIGLALTAFLYVLLFKGRLKPAVASMETP